MYKQYYKGLNDPCVESKYFKWGYLWLIKNGWTKIQEAENLMQLSP
jgi:hypothetical protein